MTHPAASAYRPATLALRLKQGPLAADKCVRCPRQLADFGLLTTSGRSNRPATTTMPRVAAPPRLAPIPETVTPVGVAVNFITEPLEAEVMIDATREVVAHWP